MIHLLLAGLLSIAGQVAAQTLPDRTKDTSSSEIDEYLDQQIRRERLQRTGTQTSITWADGTVQVSSPSSSRPDYIIVKGTRPAGTDDGSSTAGSWLDRRLNWEEVDTGNNVVISTNQIHLTFQPGTYRCRWSAPIFLGDQHSTRLYDQTAASVIAFGTSEFASRTSNIGSNRSHGETRFTLSVASIVILQHQTDLGQATNGLGVNSNNGQPEVYAMISCEKE